jgi:ABC-type branched-subunit amino acid transport system substrate-binding protein
VGEGAALIVLLLLALALSAAPAAAEPGVGETSILIGGSTALSGPLTFTGEQLTKYGVDLYLKVINDAGGIHGRTVSTRFYDDGQRPSDAMANTRKLVEQDAVFAIIVPQGWAPIVAMLDYLEPNKVPLLFPYQSPPLTRGRRYVFPGAPLPDRSSKMTIDYLAGTRKYKRFAALYQDDAYGKAFLTALQGDLARFGLKLAAAERVEVAATDVSAPVTKIRAARPEATFLVLVPGPASRVLRERQRIGWTDTLMVSMGPLTDERYLSLAGEAARGVEGLSYWPDPMVSDLPGIQLYRAYMQKHFPKNDPNRHSLAGYFAGMLFTEAAQRAGRTLTRESLIAGLESLKEFKSGLVPPLTIGRDHETQKQGFWVRLENGRFTPLTDWLASE